jgi:hypothetical protein
LLKEPDDASRIVLPEYQTGFRSILAGIYTHTNQHIIAAPMAHFLALHESRFMFSHRHTYLPAYGIEQILADANMIMCFKNLDGNQVAYHRGMDYLFRPIGMENMCTYEYYAKTQLVSQAQARKGGLETFQLEEKHPFSERDCVVYREKDCVPVFAWNWLGCTEMFSTSIMDRINVHHIDHKTKEKYAKRFMILFYPFRNESDLVCDGMYQKRLQEGIRNMEIKSEMLLIAENIQTIHNSLNSKMPENMLLAGTDLPELDERDTDDQGARSIEAVLYNTGSCLASTSGISTMTEDSGSFTPAFTAEMSHVGIASLDAVFNDLETVFYENDIPSTDSNEDDTPLPSCRFKTKVSELNTLTMQNFIRRNGAEEMEEGSPSNVNVDATGSWKSILAWGKRANLDPEQQTAFEILAATYVLTFFEEGDIDTHLPAASMEHFESEKERLRQLARQKPEQETPLRLFVTGPAGAGKCMVLYERNIFVKVTCFRF